jgi:hypothetical protein
VAGAIGGESRRAELARLGLQLGIAAAVFQGIVHLVDVGLLGNRYASLNADKEFNIFSWASASATFAAGVMVLLVAFLRRDRTLSLLGLILWFFSLDDMLSFHEAAAHLIRTHVGLPERDVRLIWPALFFPLLAVAAVLLWRLAATFEPRVQRVVFWGLALLVLAVFLEIGSTLLVHGDNPHGTAYAIEVVFEEGSELAAWIAIAAAVAAEALRDAATTLAAISRADGAGNGAGRRETPASAPPVALR